MSFEEPNDPRTSEIGNNQIQLTELATYEEQIPVVHFPKTSMVASSIVTNMSSMKLTTIVNRCFWETHPRQIQPSLASVSGQLNAVVDNTSGIIS